MKWQNGKLYDVASGRELMYYHLQELKLHPRFYVPSWRQMPPAFLLSRKGATWIGEQDLRKRLRTAVDRWRYFVTRSGAIAWFYLRWPWAALRHAFSARRGTADEPATG